MSADEKPRRRWLAFSLRELLLFTAIAGLAVGWYLDHSRLVHSEAFRVGGEIAEDVRMLYENNNVADPLGVDFGFNARPFRATLSISDYYADHPDEHRPRSLAILPFSP